LDFFVMYFIQHCFICLPSDSTVSEDAGIEPRTVATRLDLIHYSARSHPQLGNGTQNMQHEGRKWNERQGRRPTRLNSTMKGTGHLRDRRKGERHEIPKGCKGKGEG
jgi:hypothetical protein